MIISSIGAYSPSINTSAAVNKSAAANAAVPDSALPLVTSDDVAILARFYGKSDLKALEADPSTLTALTALNGARARGDVQGSLANYMPTASLTDSDVALFEQMTGTTSIQAASNSSFDASALMLQVGASRQNGSLTGDLTPGYLNDYLAASQSASASSANPGLASPTFVKEAIADLEATTGNASFSKIDTIA
jgi:hypothetical protein